MFKGNIDEIELIIKYSKLVEKFFEKHLNIEIIKLKSKQKSTSESANKNIVIWFKKFRSILYWQRKKYWYKKIKRNYNSSI